MTASPEATIQRIGRLTRRVMGPIQQPVLILAVGLVLETIAGGAVGLLTLDPLLAGLVALGVAIVVTVLALLPLLNPVRRRAFATVFDHVFRERELWKAETGTAVPQTRGAMRRWLEAHPDAPARGALLLILGRLDEADAAIEALPESTDRERFERESARQTAALYRGKAVDLRELRRLRTELRDPTLRRDSAQCIAALEAFQAADAGGNPMTPLADAWVAEHDGAWVRRPAFLLLRLLVPALVFVPVLLASAVVLIRALSSTS
jgi:hypothetical protein